MQYWSSNRNKILVTVVVVLSIVLLFFLPELLNWQYAVDDPRFYQELPVSTRVLDSNEGFLENDRVPAVSEEMRPLDEIAYLIDSGYVESARSKRAGQILRQQYQEGLIEPTWAQLRSNDALSELRRLRSQGLLVLQGLADRHVRARNALVDFIGVVSFLLEDANQVLRPREALDLLHNHYIDATAALADTSVDRTFFLQWSEVELGPLLDTVISEAALHRMRPFDPQIKVINVGVYQSQDFEGRPDPEGRTALWIEGQVRGEDLKSLVLERDGEQVTRLMVRPVAGQSNVGRFEYTGRGAAGLWTIRAFDQLGNEFYKTYRFFPRVRVFPYRDGEFRVTLPVGDPRIDRYFLVARTQLFRPSTFFDNRGIARF